MRHDMMPDEARAVIVVAGCKEQIRQEPAIERTHPESSRIAGGSHNHGVGGAFLEEQRKPRLWRIGTPLEGAGEGDDEESPSDE